MVAMSTLVSVLFAISILKYLEATGESAAIPPLPSPPTPLLTPQALSVSILRSLHPLSPSWCAVGFSSTVLALVLDAKVMADGRAAAALA